MLLDEAQEAWRVKDNVVGDDNGYCAINHSAEALPGEEHVKPLAFTRLVGVPTPVRVDGLLEWSTEGCVDEQGK